MLAPAKITVPSATARTGSPMVPAMSSPRWRRAPPSRSSPGPLVATRGGASSGDTTVRPMARLARGVRRLEIGGDHPAPRGQDQILLPAGADLVTPDEVRDAGPVSHPAEALVQLFVAGVPHLQQRGAGRQVRARLHQDARRELAAIDRRLGRARDAVHGRLDAEQPVAAVLVEIGVTLGPVVPQRRQRERIAVRDLRRRQHLQGQRALGRRRIDAAQVRVGDPELRGVDRRRRPGARRARSPGSAAGARASARRWARAPATGARTRRRMWRRPGRRRPTRIWHEPECPPCVKKI